MPKANLKVAAEPCAADAQLIELCEKYFQLRRREDAIYARDYKQGEVESIGEKISALWEEIVKTPAESSDGVLAKVYVLAEWDDWDDPANMQVSYLANHLSLSIAADIRLHYSRALGRMQQVDEIVGPGHWLLASMT